MAVRLTLAALRYAEVLADAGSFMSASRRLGISQPALSISIAKLEEHLGRRLFLRDPQGVTPTAFGAAILPRITQVISDIARLEAEVEAFAASQFGALCVGISPKIDKAIVRQLGERIHGAGDPSRGSNMTILEAQFELLEAALHSGSADMIMVPALGSLRGYSHRLIGSDYLVLIDPESDATGTAITIDQLAERELIVCRDGCGLTRLLSDVLSESGHTLTRSLMEVSHCTVLPGWADKGLGAVVIPERHVPSGMEARRIVQDDGSFLEIFYEVVWDPNSPLAMRLELLADSLSETFLRSLSQSRRK